MAYVWGDTMTDATRKATHLHKQRVGLVAQLLAVLAMMMIAGVVLYAR